MSKFGRGIALLFLMAALPRWGFSDVPPAWAYPINPSGVTAVADDGGPRRVPDSSVHFTRKKLTAIAGPVSDWHPEEHPVMPPIVGRGRPPQVFSCGYCHLPTGAGRPENASIAGLSVNYFKTQMQAFRQGDRIGSAPARAPETNMIALAKGMTEAEIDEAAHYFAGLKPAFFTRVIEAETVPKAVVAAWTWKAAPEGGTEPLGHRILEMPEDFERFENRDSRTAYVAYVPRGSIERGAALVTNGGGGRTVQCATCHGPDLRGLLDVPRLVGRSPSYLMRQLYDLKSGTRRGGAAELMKPVVTQLSEDDMLAISAYLASQRP